MTGYDKELINARPLEVCDYYLPGEGKREGNKRRIWECPLCGGDDFAANSQREIAGCLSAGCDVPRATDAVGVIAYFEGLELAGEQFVRCLQKGYEILGIPEPEEESPSNDKGGRRSFTPGADRAASGPQAPEEEEVSRPDEDDWRGDNEAQSTTLTPKKADRRQEETSSPEAAATAPDPQPQRELTDRVYRAFLGMCPLVEAHRQWWLSRGVTEETMTEAGLGSIWPQRCHEVLPELERRFGLEALTSVPGFYASSQGRVHTNLYDDYTLIPYHDREGYITMVQGRVPGEPEEGKPKYMAPVGSGLHLYVYPRFKPEQTMAFVEGAVGAIVAAQSGIPVAAIAGFQHYRISGSKDESDNPLPEHEDTDFGGRKVLYIPDEDVKPEVAEAVAAEAPKAARFLIERHGGKPLLARLPEGYKDLDEWLLSFEEVERVPAFASLMPAAITPGQWEGSEPLEEDNGDPSSDHKDSQKKGAREVGQSVLDEEGSSKESSEEEQTGDGHQEEPPRVKTRQPQPRRYTPIPRTNFGEFMVASIYAVGTMAAVLVGMLYAAPKWSPTSFLAAVPVWATIAGSLIVAAAVLGLRLPQAVSPAVVCAARSPRR